MTSSELPSHLGRRALRGPLAHNDNSRNLPTPETVLIACVVREFQGLRERGEAFTTVATEEDGAHAKREALRACLALDRAKRQILSDLKRVYKGHGEPSHD